LQACGTFLTFAIEGLPCSMGRCVSALRKRTSQRLRTTMRNLIRARKTPNIRDLWIGPLLDRSFRVSISLKGLHALLETICAIALLKIDPQTMNRFVLGRSASRTLRRSTRFRRHAPNPCVSVLCGQRKVLRLFVSSFARRRQTRARYCLAKEQTLGLSIDGCHFSCVCLLSESIGSLSPIPF